MLRLYNTALVPLRVAVAIRAAWSSRDPARRLEWDQRRARRLPSVAPGGVWIHGASVGEARIVAALAERLRQRRPQLPIAVSATTSAGRESLPEAPRVDTSFFLPLDFRAFARRALETIRPSLLVLVETELWPNLLHEADRCGVPVAVVNGRLSASRMTRYLRLGRLFAPLLRRLTAVGAQSHADAARFRELGVSQQAVQVTGNIKYDLPTPPVDGGRASQRLGPARGRPLFVAGSTAPGEEGPLLDAAERARRCFPELLLVVAPRHIVRTEEVAKLLADRGARVVRYASDEPLTEEVDTLLVDTLGDLPALYGAARVAFVGGSLVPVGGHNLLEPAAAGVPVLFGPHTDHFAEPAAALLQAGGGRCVRDATELAQALLHWLGHEAERSAAGNSARGLVDGARGALDRNLELLLGILGEQPRAPRAVDS